MIRFREGHLVELKSGRSGNVTKIFISEKEGKITQKLTVQLLPEGKSGRREIIEVDDPESNVKLIGWIMPIWMEGYRTYLEHFTGGNPIEELMNDHHTTTDINVVRSMICVSLKSVVSFLERLYTNGHLIPIWHWYRDGPCCCDSSSPGFVAQDNIHCGYCGGTIKQKKEEE